MDVAELIGRLDRSSWEDWLLDIAMVVHALRSGLFLVLLGLLGLPGLACVGEAVASQAGLACAASASAAARRTSPT